MKLDFDIIYRETTKKGKYTTSKLVGRNIGIIKNNSKMAKRGEKWTIWNVSNYIKSKCTTCPSKRSKNLNYILKISTVHTYEIQHKKQKGWNWEHK